MRAKEGGKETTGETSLRLPSVHFPWFLAVHHQSLAFRAGLCRAKNEAPEGEAGFRAFSICAPQLWNALPLDLRVCHSVDSFKKALKTCLFKDLWLSKTKTKLFMNVC